MRCRFPSCSGSRSSVLVRRPPFEGASSGPDRTRSPSEPVTQRLTRPAHLRSRSCLGFTGLSLFLGVQVGVVSPGGLCASRRWRRGVGAVALRRRRRDRLGSSRWPMTRWRCSTGLWSSYLNFASTRASPIGGRGCLEASVRRGFAGQLACPPSGWKTASWASRRSALRSGSSTTVGRQTNWTVAVVARRYAVFVGSAGLGPRVGRDVGVVTDHREPDLGGGLEVRPHRVRTGEVDEQLVAGEGEVRRHQTAGPVRVEDVDGQHAELVGRGQPVLPFL